VSPICFKASWILVFAEDSLWELGRWRIRRENPIKTDDNHQAVRGAAASGVSRIL